MHLKYAGSAACGRRSDCIYRLRDAKFMMSLLQTGCHCVYSSSGKSIDLFWFSLSMLVVKTVNKWYYIVTTDVYDGFLIRYSVSCITESSIIVKEPGESITLRCSWSKAMMNMLTYICSRRVKQESLLWRISQKKSY